MVECGQRLSVSSACLVAVCATAAGASAGDGYPFWRHDLAGIPGLPPLAIARLEAADVDADGDVDVIIGLQFANQFRWLENLGPAEGGGVNFIGHSGPLGAGGDGIAVADLDGDGDLDVVMGGESTVSWYESAPGAGGSPNWIERDVDAASFGAEAIAAGDMEGDGDIDFAAYVGAGAYYWYENDGASPPGFTEHFVTATPTSTVFRIGAADFDQDGDVDLAFDGPGFDLRQYVNNGEAPPSFTPVSILDLTTLFRSAHTADLDLDGDIDIVCVGSFSTTWHRNRGMVPAQFETQSIQTSGGVYVLESGDVDGDGDVDLAGGGVRPVDGFVAWWENNPHPGSGIPVYSQRAISLGGDVAYSTRGDLDGDGDVDIIGLRGGGNNRQITWFEAGAEAPPLPPCYDLDGDGEVGGADLGILLGSWGAMDSIADIDGDGTVDGVDLALLLGGWGVCG